MAEREVIDITSDDDVHPHHASDDDDFSDHGGPTPLERRAILSPIITRVVNALGGYDTADNNNTYVLGDEAYACLKDLKKLWRKDDVDDDRTVARIFWETRVLPNDLVPILLATAGKGLVEDKRAIATVDLMTAMTWPIDMAEELKELDDELDKNADYTQLLGSHLAYKATLLQSGVMKALFGIILPPLAKSPRERVERDGQIMNVVLHLIRNLAFIKDPPANSLGSAETAEQSTLQGRLIRVLEETRMLKLLVTIAANTDNDPLFNQWNTLVLEIFYLLFRGVKPETLAQDQAKEPTANLQRLLAQEDRNRREVARKASSRHSRFGTTISVRLNPNRPQAAHAEAAPAPGRQFVLHKQAAIHAETGSIMDRGKRQKARKAATQDAIAQEHNLGVEAKRVLQALAGDFIEGCFNAFLGGLLKDIRSERAKVSEKDHLRLLFVTKWFLEFLLTMRAKAHSAFLSSPTPSHLESLDKWDLGLIAEVTDRAWIVWVLKRMREAMEAKPKAWTELQAGMELLTQLLLLIDKLVSSPPALPTTFKPPPDATFEQQNPLSVPDDLVDAGELLQQQLVYNGEILDVAVESLRTYKEGTQSLVYLDAGVQMAFVLLRMMERWGKERGEGVYVRRRKERKKRAKKGITEEEGIPDVEDEPEEVEDTVDETLFTFENFEAKFANAEVANTLLVYLARHREYTPGGDQMKRVVGLMHRIAVKAKAEGLFFKVSTLDLFKSILAEQKSFPREQPYKDLVSLINFVLRKFFKALDAEPFLAIEVFFPKNRGHWKAYSSWEPEAKKGRGGGEGGRGGREKNNANGAEVEVKKGHSWTERMGIAIAALVDDGKKGLVQWTQEILKSVIDKRNRIVAETDRKDDEDDESEDPDNLDANGLARLQGQPSSEAILKFEDEVVPYLSNDHAEAATKNVHLKLLFRLSKFFLKEDENADEDDELEWYIPQAILPSELQQCYNVIGQFLETPFDLGGKKASELLQKKRRKRTARRRRSPSASGDDDDALSDAPARQKRKKKEQEQVQYKSAQFIEDSDEEYGDMEAFLEREKVLREKAALAALDKGDTSRPLNMKAIGTKKRRKKKGIHVRDDEETAGRPGPSRGSSPGAAGGEGVSATACSSPVSGTSRKRSAALRGGDSDTDGRGGSDGDGDDESQTTGDSDGGERGAPHLGAKPRQSDDGAAVPVSRPRPRPVPRRRESGTSGQVDASSIQSGDGDHAAQIVDRHRSGAEEPRASSPAGDEDEDAAKPLRRVKRLVLSDSDEE